jgi:hypothetical protein
LQQHEAQLSTTDVVFALQLFLFFLSQTYSQGTLTVDWAIYLAMLWTVLGAVGGAFFGLQSRYQVYGSVSLQEPAAQTFIAE